MTSFIDLYNADEEVWFTGFLKLAVIFNNLEPAWEKTDSESPADSFLGLGLPTASRELLGPERPAYRALRPRWAQNSAGYA